MTVFILTGVLAGFNDKEVRNGAIQQWRKPDLWLRAAS